MHFGTRVLAELKDGLAGLAHQIGIQSKTQHIEGSVVKVHQSDTQLINFLQEELDISAKSIAFALRHSQQDPGPLPMILWQYGLVSIEQLEQIFDWLEG